MGLPDTRWVITRHKPDGFWAGFGTSIPNRVWGWDYLNPSQTRPIAIHNRRHGPDPPPPPPPLTPPPLPPKPPAMPPPPPPPHPLTHTFLKIEEKGWGSGKSIT